MKPHTFLSLPILAMAMTATSQAAIVLATDFTGVDRTTTPTATNITWSPQLNLTIDTPDLTIISEYGTGSPAIRTDNNANRIGVNYNVETGGGRSWSTFFTITTTTVLDLTSFNVAYHAISGGGDDQVSATKNGDFTFTLYSGAGTGGAQLFTETKDNLAETSPALGAVADYDLSGLSNLSAGTYTIKLQVEAGSEALGNNWAMDNIELNADAVPEPSSTALLGLGGIALILRRRK
ncbi:hypothetical protein NT6N_26310 [Oceaniferula spumae]|uniref:Ice-binding protein C-terminal domain-containing protein n=1 Tax=Oceaniferula spumae TaxID=2979115 RepID=A0AAT9FNV0_9BACT